MTAFLPSDKETGAEAWFSFMQEMEGFQDQPPASMSKGEAGTEREVREEQLDLFNFE